MKDGPITALAAPANLRAVGWGLLLAIAVIVVYQPVWSAGFVWDDQTYLLNNPNLFGLTGLKNIWTTTAADISPLTFTTFWIEHALWGLAPLPYHLVNVLLQAACAVVLWRVLLRLGVPGAWFGAALWALHPVQVESVAWITETKNTESGLFSLLSTLCFLRGLGAKDSTPPSRSGWDFAGTLIFAALAMASKSSTVILPVVLALCAWWKEGRWQWRTLVRLTPLFLLSLATGLVSMWTQALQLHTIDPKWARTLPERVAGAGDAVWFYLGKLVWPYPLSNNYPRWEIDAGQAVSYVPSLAVAAVFALLWFNRNSSGRPLFFAFAYFLVALFPVIGLLDNPIFRYSLVFDHLQYLAGIGPLALIGAGFALAADAVPSGIAWARIIAGAAVLTLLGVISWQRVWVFQNEQTLWSNTLLHNPESWVAYNNLGHALADRGDLNDGITLYRKALALNPTEPEAHTNLGIALFQTGQKDEAMIHLQRSLELDSNSAQAHNNLANALFMTGQLDAAVAQYQTAIALNPYFRDPHRNLGVLYARKGQLDDAITQLQAAVALNPGDTQTSAALAQLEAARQQAAHK